MSPSLRSPPSAPPNNSTQGSPPLPGALNGTSIAILSVGLQDRLDYHLFYQNSKSQIRRLEGIYGTSFSGGLPVIPANARDATPLAVASYGTYGTSNFTVRALCT